MADKNRAHITQQLFLYDVESEQINPFLSAGLIDSVQRNNVALAALKQRCGHQEGDLWAAGFGCGFQEVLFKDVPLLQEWLQDRTVGRLLAWAHRKLETY